MCQQVVGNVDVETIFNGDRNDFIEDRDDIAHCVPAPHQRIITGTCCRNIHHEDFSPNGNDLSWRYSKVRAAYSSIAVIARSVTQSIEGPAQSFADFVREYDAFGNLMMNKCNSRPNAGM